MNLWSVLTLGGSSMLKTLWNAISGKSSNSLDKVLGYLDNNVNLGSSIENLSAKLTGERLTNAEREANAFTAEREDLAWQRQMDASNTAYQRQVADMQAAGINPMMAVSGGSGAAVPSASVQGSVTPSGASLNLGSILSAISGMKVSGAQSELLEAEAAKANAETNKILSETDYFNSVKSIRAEAERKSLSLTDSQIQEKNAIIKSLYAKAENDFQRAALSKVEAANIEYMQSFMAGYYDSLSKANQAKADLDLIDAAYSQRMLDSGAVEAAVRSTLAGAAKAEQDRVIGVIEAGLKAKEFNEKPNADSSDPVERVLGALGRDIKIILGKI